MLFRSRKPKSGLITDYATRERIELSESIVVGDRWRDIEAGKRAGCRSVFIDCGYNEALLSVPDHTATSLNDAMGWVRSIAG